MMDIKELIEKTNNVVINGQNIYGGAVNYDKYNQKISVLFTILGQRCLSGDVEALKFLYKNAWREDPPYMKTIYELQSSLTSVDIKNDTKGIYNNEFLYYLGMICLGEVSPVIFKKLDTAAYCFKRIKGEIPKAKARLAYIGILNTKEPTSSIDNVRRRETLRRWMKNGDLFSRIVLARISFFHFLEEDQANDPIRMPMNAESLLNKPCQMGHPVAIRFYKEMRDYISSIASFNARDRWLGYSNIIKPVSKDKRIAEFRVNPDALLDL